MPLPRVSLREIYDVRLQSELETLGFSVHRPGALADAVAKLSQYYLSRTHETSAWSSPLKHDWARAAYLAYFFPLNYSRASAVVAEGVRRGFFDGLDSFIDFGSGVGSASLALFEQADFSSGLVVDSSSDALSTQTRLAKAEPFADRFEQRIESDPNAPWLGLHMAKSKRRLASFSYALTELRELPAWALEAEALLIVEPSTRADGRRLQELRSELIDAGFKAWAPCPHQNACPLLKNEKDWCHARALFAQPPWWQKLENLLPMKNRAIAYSYLLMRKTAPPALTLRESRTLARTVGDPRVEKGKTRIALCRGPDREILTWFPQRLKEEISLNRGDLLSLAQDLEIKGTASIAPEVRIDQPSDVEIL